MDENTSENLAAKRLELGRAKVLQYIVRYAREIYPGWDKGAVYFRLVSEQYYMGVFHRLLLQVFEN